MSVKTLVPQISSDRAKLVLYQEINAQGLVGLNLIELNKMLNFSKKGIFATHAKNGIWIIHVKCHHVLRASSAKLKF